MTHSFQKHLRANFRFGRMPCFFLKEKAGKKNFNPLRTA